MEIEQYLYDLNESGDAILAYKMVAECGASVEVCNLGASVMSLILMVDGDLREVLTSGRVARGMNGLVDGMDIVGGAPFEEKIWESRVEGNRVVMALNYDDKGANVMTEVVFDFDDDCSFEITYKAYVEGSAEVDLSHALSFDMGGDMSLGGALLEPVEPFDGVFDVVVAQPNILNFVATLGSDECEDVIEILTSQPSLYCDEGIVMPLTVHPRTYSDGERFVQKSVYRIMQIDS